MTTTRRKLTDLDLEVLRAAARNDGSLYRSEAYPMHSYLIGPGMHRKINRHITKLTSGDEPLLQLRERQYRSPWLLTDAGRAALNAADKKVTR